MSEQTSPAACASQLIVEALKELSSESQPLTSTVLCAALSRRREITDLFGGRGGAQACLGQCRDRGMEDMRGRLRELGGVNERLSRRAADLEEEVASLRAFCRRGLAKTLALVPEPGEDLFSERLARLKRAIFEEGDIRRLENAILALGGWGDPSPGAPAAPPGREADPLATVEASLFRHLRGVYLAALEAFASEVSGFEVETCKGLFRRVEGACAPADLLVLKDDLHAFIRRALAEIREERSRIADFLSGFWMSLLDLEQHILSSLGGIRETHEAGGSFASTVEHHVDGLDHCCRASQSLSELTGRVLERLSALRSAIETQRSEDARRFEAAREGMRNLQGSLSRMKREIVRAQERTRVLERQALRDSLTGLYNRRAHDERLREELNRYRRYGQGFSLLFMDVDRFKTVNDQYGHFTGDRCLREIARRLRPVLRETDFLARHGGEEFSVILPATPLDGACLVAEKLRAVIEKTRFLSQGREISVTVSIGVTCALPADRRPGDIFRRADGALHQAKRAGRNRVDVVEEETGVAGEEGARHAAM